jgi:integrase
MILTGARIGEVLALTRSDVRPDGLLIDETSFTGGLKLPKRGKIRLAALPGSLREELTAWLATHGHERMFPSVRGKVLRRNAQHVEDIQDRGRALGIPDLDFRMCRTTFASLFEGDEADRTSIMGHHSTRFTLEHYRKPILERRQRSVEDLDRRLKVVKMPRRKRA